MKALVLALLLASPAAASGDVVGAWRDLQDRCRAAVAGAERLDVEGLESRAPSFIARSVEDPLFGERFVLDVLRTSARTVPTGIWGPPGGRFEMQLLEFVTRPGTRAICEVRPARGGPDLTATEADAIWEAFDADRAEAVHGGGYVAADTRSGQDTRRAAIDLAGDNPRGCPVVVSLTVRPGYFRSSAAERAGVPGCGGPSLAEGGLTLPPSALNPRSAP